MSDTDDVEITYVKGSGPGGQHRNKRETGVRLHHVPTGIVVTATERRERQQNLALAWERLSRALAARRRKPKPRRRTRPTKASVQRRLAEKARRARTKDRRRKPDDDS
ncbi:MAG: peptide chain release factor family protein [Planctomycetota bacterium]